MRDLNPSFAQWQNKHLPEFDSSKGTHSKTVVLGWIVSHIPSIGSYLTAARRCRQDYNINMHVTCLRGQLHLESHEITIGSSQKHRSMTNPGIQLSVTPASSKALPTATASAGSTPRRMATKGQAPSASAQRVWRLGGWEARLGRSHEMPTAP